MLAQLCCPTIAILRQQRRWVARFVEGSLFAGPASLVALGGWLTTERGQTVWRAAARWPCRCLGAEWFRQQSDAGIHAVGGPAASGHDGIVGQRDDVQDGGSDVLGPFGRQRDVWQRLVGQRWALLSPFIVGEAKAYRVSLRGQDPHVYS
jgi:hypothetical protein